MSILHDIPGGSALFDWFGYTATFHDGELPEIRFTGKGDGLLRIHARNMTDVMDDAGHFILDQHMVVTLTLQGVSQINRTSFDTMPGIILHMYFSRADENFRIRWRPAPGWKGSPRQGSCRSAWNRESPGSAGCDAGSGPGHSSGRAQSPEGSGRKGGARRPVRVRRPVAIRR